MRVQPPQVPAPPELLGDARLVVQDGLALGRAGPERNVEADGSLTYGLPAPGWIRAVQRARLLQDGWLDEECELWDSEGRLVVQARQLAGYRVPAG